MVPPGQPITAIVRSPMTFSRRLSTHSLAPAGTNDNKALFNAAFQEWETEANTRANGSVVGEGGALVRNPAA